MIRLVGVSKYYNQHTGLDDINLDIAQGDMVFITGHSGAGKTSILKLLMMIERCSKGQVYINNQNLNNIKRKQVPHLRRQMGMVFQDPKLIATMSVYDNVALPLVISGLKPKEIRRRVQAALDKVSLLEKAEVFPVELSCGEQQRIGIARAVVNRPPILLADEPTGNLDPDLSMDIMALFEAFNDVGVTVVIATHDLAIIAQMHHRIVSLKQGKIIAAKEAYV